jgi:hypothetical protein
MTEPRAYAGQLLYDLRTVLDDLVTFRNSREGSVLLDDEVEIMTDLNTLQFIATDLAETRRKEAQALRR